MRKIQMFKGTLVFSDKLSAEAQADFAEFFIDATLPEYTRNDVAKYIKDMLIKHQTHNDFILLNKGKYAKRNVERLVLYYMFCANQLSIGGYAEHMAFAHHAELYLPDSLHPMLNIKKIAQANGAKACYFGNETPEMIKQVGTIYLDKQNLYGRVGIDDEDLNDLYKTIMDRKHSDCYQALWLNVATDASSQLGDLVSKGSAEMRKKFQVASSLMTKKVVNKFLENNEFSFMVSILAAHNQTSSSTAESTESLVKGMNMPSVEQNATVNQDKKRDELSVSKSSNVFSDAAQLSGGFLDSTGMQSPRKQYQNESKNEEVELTTLKQG